MENTLKVSFEVDHVLVKLLDGSNGDLARILEHFEIDASRLSKRLMWRWWLRRQRLR